MRILVTGTGGGTGLVVTKLLSRAHAVVATDADAWAAGMHIPDVTSRLVPYASDARYLDTIWKICAEDEIDAIIAGTEEEQYVFACNQREISARGIKYWGSRPEAIVNCMDKWQFFERMRSSRIPVPDTWLETPPRDTQDLVVKPRTGRGSHDIYFANDVATAMTYAELIEEPLIQRRAHGVEFTADCLALSGQEPLIALRSRLRVRAGVSTAGITFHDDEARRVVADTIRALGVSGAVCVQGIIGDSGLEIIEANARFAGSFVLTEQAGADLLERYVGALSERPPRFERFDYRAGVSMIRSWAEIFEVVEDAGRTKALQ